MLRLAGKMTLAAAVLLSAGMASAQDPYAPPVDPMAPPVDPMTGPAADPGVAPMVTTTAGAVPAALVQRGVQGPAGSFSADVFLFANMSKEMAFKPFSLTPDLYYAVSDQLQLGLRHTSPLGWQTPGSRGPSLCLAGKENGCGDVYNNVAVEALWALLTGPTDLSARVSYWISNLSDPMVSQLGLGLAGKLHLSDTLALRFDPTVMIGLQERDFQKDGIILPVELQLQLSPIIALVVQAALSAPFDGFGDAYSVPVGIAALYNVNQMIDVGLRFGFDNLLGETGGAGRADYRTLALLVGLRF